MKVLMINGSPHENGCTYTALSEVGAQLEKNGVETIMLHIGTAPVRDCIACMKCRTIGRCAFDGDLVNKASDLLAESDGLVVGSPVYFAGPSGAICSFMDRMCYSRSADFALKPAAAVVSCRRGGASASFDRLNKYFTILRMPVVSSQYWNSVHGNTPDEVRRDLEGLQTMRTLGDNMAWMLKNIQSGNAPLPQREPPVRTNFIGEK